ncbi:hypothetical protein O181_008578 [Austropuccinia psidii MF-1]|uniref:Uncharacterized protein n=1 Tax=Austropuccinia psidii MF-1 TaxID=1389203 RepID=A0A9Q3GIM5_9BASI|nr:hypothetical protein [Austropuccinia psidii MF-1]
MSPVHLRDLGFLRHQTEDREGLSRTSRPGRGHLGHIGGWKDIEGNNTHSAIHILIKQKPQTRGLEGYGSSSSAPPTPQGHFSMKHGQQEVQPGIPLGRTWSKLQEDLSQRDRLQRPYGNHQRLESHQEVQTPADSFKLTSSRPNQLSSGFPQFRNQQISGQESPFVAIPGIFLEKTRIQGQKQDHLQPKEGRVRPNDPEAVEFGEITPTQIENSFVTPESNLNSDALWLQRSQFAEKTPKKFSEIEASHKKMKTLTASMDKIVKTIL